MPHRLNFSVSIRNKQRYRNWLQPLEVVRGIASEFSLEVENQGEYTFPGGTIDSFYIESPVGGVTLFKYEFLVRWRIPRLDPKETHTFSFTDFRPLCAGISRVIFTVISDDKDKVEHVSTEYPASEEKFSYVFYVIEREIVELLMTLREMKIGEKIE